MEVKRDTDALKAAYDRTRVAMDEARKAYEDKADQHRHATRQWEAALLADAQEAYEAQGFVVGVTPVMIRLEGSRTGTMIGPYIIGGFKMGAWGNRYVALPDIRKIRVNGKMSLASPLYSNINVTRYEAAQ